MGAIQARRYLGKRTVGLAGRFLSTGLVAAIATTLLGAGAATAKPTKEWAPPKPREVAGVATKPVSVRDRPMWTSGSRELTARPVVRWPAAGSATVEVNAAGARVAASAGGALAKAGSLPVWVGQAPADSGPAALSATPVVGKVRVAVRDRAATASAGVAGLLIDVSRADQAAVGGSVTLKVDYAGFADAYGGDWASRLRFVLPDGNPLPSQNDLTTRTVSAVAPLAAGGGVTTMAVSAGPSGPNGDYTATSLTPASTWQVSAQTGDFNWSYPLRVVPGVGGPEPKLALGYSSGSVDGRTGGTNTQTSWLGDGWDMWPGFIERQYVSCGEDKDEVDGKKPNSGSVHGGDQCWHDADGAATISLNGRATELAKSAGNTWKGVSDDGSKIELLKNASFGNGDNDGEYWKVTGIDGTEYYFGRNNGVGGSSASTETNSTWTMPVYGNHPGEPGYQADDFAGSRETQAWRWNLDYTVDTNGNTMTYFYQKEQGAYGREGDVKKRTTYDRSGWLSRIEYGSREDAPASTRPAARVVFQVDDRCASNCFADGEPVKASFRDTPWDQYCKEEPCKDILFPTFWTSKRLSVIKSQVYSGSGDGYDDVEWWTLRHTYLDAGVNEGKPMWLVGITRTGKVTGPGVPEVSDPEIVFDAGDNPLPNRVDGTNDGKSNLFRYRVRTITTESGAQLTVDYAKTECTRGDLPTPDTNTKRCYPQQYAPPGEEPKLDWFHKHRVERVDVYDNTGGFEHEQTNYDYLDKPAWHYDDSELVKKKNRTWGQFRGYGHVRIRKGLESGVQSATEYRYFRGMDGDKLTNGVRPASVIDSQKIEIADHEAYAGMLREEITTLGVGGPWLHGAISTPVKQGPKATDGPLKSWMANTGTVRSRTRLADDSTRWTKTVTTFNGDNLPIKVENINDESTPADDTCARTWYARNATTWILDAVKRTETVSGDCDTPLTEATALSSTRKTYDKETNDWDSYLPVKGDVAKVEELDSWTGGKPNWVVTGRSKYDANGRALEDFDALNRRTKTDYVPDLAGPVTSSTITNPAGQVSVNQMATAWNVPSKILDKANDLRTELAYDALGRAQKVWLPGRSKDANPTAPNVQFTYQLRNKGNPTAITTTRLIGDGTKSVKSVELFDGLLRLRQQQTQAPGGGRVLTDNIYDSRGLMTLSAGSYYDTTNAPPGGTLVAGPGWPAIPAVTENVYDGAGRLTDAIFKAGPTEKWRTKTTYDGDRTSVTPPRGGTATTTITDALGRSVERREYRDPAKVGDDDETTFTWTKYGYTPRGELKTVSDQAGNLWRHTYDQRGRKTIDEDPDKGITKTWYDAAGQAITVEDARKGVLAYKYDDLGRKQTVREGSAEGKLRAEWIRDTLPKGVGKINKSIRYHPAGSTNAYVNEVIGYDDTGRPTGTKVTIPSTESDLCAAGGSTPCSYSFTSKYRMDGRKDEDTLPAVADLAGETLAYTYNDIGSLRGMVSAGQSYVSDVTYDKVGNLTQRVLGARGKRTALTYAVNEATGRLMTAVATPEGRNQLFNYEYGYDEYGNLTKIADTPNGGQAAETQCFAYDYLRRLKDAWTPASGACSPPVDGGQGGPASYWHTYEYDTTGNRIKEIRHGLDQERTFSHAPADGKPGSKPHAVTGVQYTGSNPKTQEYAYDSAGNTICRPDGTAANSCQPGGAGSQTLTWDAEGHLETDSANATSYVYGADGERLIRRDSKGATLYLPAGTEVRRSAGGAVTCARFYQHLGVGIAVRTAGSLQWLVGDHHHTASVSINNADQSVARQRTLPFGEIRGTTGSWPLAADKGFVGGTRDDTGLTHLGAREYDPILGRFISVDPIVEPDLPQSLHGYSYAWNNPGTLSDPDGQWPNLIKAGAKALGSVAATVNNHVKAVGSYVVDHSGAWSAALGVAAVGCAFLPGLQPLAALLGAASAAFGLIDTVKSCASKDWVDCGIGVAGLVPGAKVVAMTVKLRKLRKLKEAAGRLNDVDNRFVNLALQGRPARTIDPSDTFLMRSRNAARESYADYARQISGINDYQRKMGPWDTVSNVFLLENVVWESCKTHGHCDRRPNESCHRMIFDPYNSGGAGNGNGGGNSGGNSGGDNGGNGKGGVPPGFIGPVAPPPPFIGPVAPSPGTTPGC